MRLPASCAVKNTPPGQRLWNLTKTSFIIPQKVATQLRKSGKLKKAIQKRFPSRALLTLTVLAIAKFGHAILSNTFRIGMPRLKCLIDWTTPWHDICKRNFLQCLEDKTWFDHFCQIWLARIWRGARNWCWAFFRLVSLASFCVYIVIAVIFKEIVGGISTR